MFELTITNNQNSKFGSSPENKYGFSGELHECISFVNHQIIISGLRFAKEKGDFCETQEYVIAIVGKAFYRMNYSSSNCSVDAEEILNLYSINGKDIFKQLKGNFIIAIYNKKKAQIVLVKDMLGLKYLYYKSDNTTFYLSTNLSDFKHITNKINYAAVIEKMLFTYPIGEESYLEDVFMLEQGGILSIEKGLLEKDTYVSLNDLFPNQLPLDKFSEQTFLDKFEKSVIQRAGVSDKINVSLTGGFDGRSNVAVLLKNNKKFHSYSFGKQGGENTKVPLNVSKKLGLDYEPIFLGDDYEANYARCAMDAVYFSDGISIFERANYIYAMQKLVKYSNYNITGLIGGEIFAPVHLKTDYINSTYFDIIYLGLDFSIDTLLAEKDIKEFINSDITANKSTKQKILNNIEIRRNLINEWKNQEFGWLYYLKDLISLGFRQFYGNQMHLERYYNENLSPFYDVDLMEYIFSTRHVLIYQDAFKSSPLLRRNNRKFQNLIINHFNRKLASIPVDRGYPPIYTKDLRLFLIPYFYYYRRYKKKHLTPEFDTPSWCKILYRELINNADNFSETLLKSEVVTGALEKYNKTSYNKSFNQMLSIAIWLKKTVSHA
jgi:hypothetical protein